MYKHDIITILVTVVTHFGQLIYNVNYRYEPFGCLTILFHTPVVFINSSIWSGDQTKLSSSVSALNISSLFSVSASQFLIRWIGVSTSFLQYLHNGSMSGLDFFA
jgi:hypothetical protein